MQTYSAPPQPAPPLFFGWQPHGSRTQSLHDALEGNGHVRLRALRVRETNRSALPGWKHTGGASTVIALEEVLWQIERWYHMPEPESVRNFVRQNSSLATLLIDAVDPLYRYFGPDPRVSLKVISDPEIEDYDELFAVIKTSLPADEALERLDALDEHWFLDQLDRASGKFNFNLEYA